MIYTTELPHTAFSPPNTPLTPFSHPVYVERPLSASAPGLGSTPSAAPKAPKASETLTKKQRQNRKTAELKKAAKADQASVQQSAFDAHRRELERERMKAQASAGKGKGKVSGGMVASVDEGGKLVWD